MKAATVHTQVIGNIISSEAQGITYIDTLISDKDPTTPRQIILGLKGLTEDTKEENIFISIKKNSSGNFVLFYKKKFYCDASTIANYLPAVMQKQYTGNIMHIFDLYYQDLAKEVV